MVLKVYLEVWHQVDMLLKGSDKHRHRSPGELTLQQWSTRLCHRHIGGIQQSTGDASMRIAKGSNRAIIYVRLSPEKLRPWIYNAYRQTLSRTILLSAMGVMITRAYCHHPWTWHGIVFEYAMVIFGWLILWIQTFPTRWFSDIRPTTKQSQTWILKNLITANYRFKGMVINFFCIASL